MNSNFNLDKRIQSGMQVSEDKFVDGLVDITQFLFAELRTLLKEEGRDFGIVLSYFKSLFQAYNSFNEAYTQEEDIDILGRVLYLFKPVLLSEYKRLCQKRLSRADSVITIIKRIMDIILEEEDNSYTHIKEVKTINKIITKLFDNIRNNSKNCILYNLNDSIRRYIRKGVIGRISLYEFSVKECDQKREKTELDPSLGNTRVEQNFNNEVKEISWTGN